MDVYPSTGTHHLAVQLNTNAVSLEENSICFIIFTIFQTQFITCLCLSLKFVASKDDAIESQGTVDDGKTCKFGDFTLNRGGTLKTEDKCTKCECSIPPYLTCIKSSC